MSTIDGRRTKVRRRKKLFNCVSLYTISSRKAFNVHNWYVVQLDNLLFAGTPLAAKRPRPSDVLPPPTCATPCRQNYHIVVKRVSVTYTMYWNYISYFRLFFFLIILDVCFGVELFPFCVWCLDCVVNFAFVCRFFSILFHYVVFMAFTFVYLKFYLRENVWRRENDISFFELYTRSYEYISFNKCKYILSQILHNRITTN